MKISGSQTGIPQLNNVTDLYVGALHKGVIHVQLISDNLPNLMNWHTDENHIKTNQPKCQ